MRERIKRQTDRQIDGDIIQYSRPRKEAQLKHIFLFLLALHNYVVVAKTIPGTKPILLL